MTSFRQAPPDPEKAARDGVANYIPSRSQVIIIFHKCEVCQERTATWEVDADGQKLYACGNCRNEYAISATNYTEKRIR